MTMHRRGRCRGIHCQHLQAFYGERAPVFMQFEAGMKGFGENIRRLCGFILGSSKLRL